jgi:hypothetical protein
MVCSCQCIVVTIDGASNDVDVDVLSNIEVVQLNYDLALQRLSAASDWHLC